MIGIVVGESWLHGAGACTMGCVVVCVCEVK